MHVDVRITRMRPHRQLESAERLIQRVRLRAQSDFREGQDAAVELHVNALSSQHNICQEAANNLVCVSRQKCVEGRIVSGEWADASEEAIGS